MPVEIIASDAPGNSRRGNKHMRTIARDIINISEGRIDLHLDPTWLPKEIADGELIPELTEYLRPLFLSWKQALKKKAGELVDRGATDEQAWDELNEINQDFFRKRNDALETFLEERGIGGKSDRLAVPTGPVTREVVRGLYANKRKWIPDSQGRPVYRRRAGKNYSILSFDHSPEIGDVAEALWSHVDRLSPETVDVFLILLNRIACLPPHEYMAHIDLKEIAQYRGVKHRDGIVGRLYDDLLRDLKVLADLRLTMVWKMDRGTLTFGKDFPDVLLHITDWEWEPVGGGQIRKAFTLRAGEPLQYFLGEDNRRGRLVGYGSKELLKLNPYHDKLAKKIGVYLVLQAVAGASHATFPRVKVGTILDYCGETLNPKRPGQSVKQVIAAFHKLKTINLIPNIPSNLIPKDRRQGYSGRWLEQVIAIEINPELCRLKEVEYQKLPPPDEDEWEDEDEFEVESNWGEGTTHLSTH